MNTDGGDGGVGWPQSRPRRDSIAAPGGRGKPTACADRGRRGVAVTRPRHWRRGGGRARRRREASGARRGTSAHAPRRWCLSPRPAHGGSTPLYSAVPAWTAAVCRCRPGRGRPAATGAPRGASLPPTAGVGGGGRPAAAPRRCAPAGPPHPPPRPRRGRGASRAPAAATSRTAAAAAGGSRRAAPRPRLSTTGVRVPDPNWWPPRLAPAPAPRALDTGLDAGSGVIGGRGRPRVHVDDRGGRPAGRPAWSAPPGVHGRAAPLASGGAPGGGGPTARRPPDMAGPTREGVPPSPAVAHPLRRRGVRMGHPAGVCLPP